MRSILSKNQIKFIRALKQKKNRYKYKKYIVEGPRMIADLMKERPQLIDYIIHSKDSKTLSIPATLDIYEVDADEFSKLSDMVTSQGVMAVCDIPAEYFKPVDGEPGFVLYMDEVQDPGNLGTMLRAASFLGVDSVWIGPGSVDPYSPKVVQSAMGSQAFVDIRHAGLQDLIHSRKPVIVADVDGENAYTFVWPDTGILVMGNEGRGPSSQILDIADHRLTILPGAGNKMESLNVSMACTSLLTLRMSQLSRIEE